MLNILFKTHNRAPYVGMVITLHSNYIYNSSGNNPSQGSWSQLTFHMTVILHPTHVSVTLHSCRCTSQRQNGGGQACLLKLTAGQLLNSVTFRS